MSDPKETPAEKISRIWKDRLTRSKRYQDDHSANWKRNESLVYGGERADEKMQVAFGYSLIKSLAAAIYVSDPEGRAEAYDETNRDKATLWTQIVNYDLSQMDVKSVGDLGFLDNAIYGYAATIETVHTDKVLRYESEDAEPKKKGRKKEEEEEPLSDVKGQNYEVRRIHPRDLLFDPQGVNLDLSDHRYIADAFYTTIGALKEDPLFKENLPEDIDEFPECSQTTRGKQNEQTRKAEDKDPDFRMICVWEVFHRIENEDGEKDLEVLYFTDHQNAFLGKTTLPFKLDINGKILYPITLMAWNPSPFGFYPTPEVEFVAPQLLELQVLDAIIYKDARTKWRKFGAYDEIVDDDDLQKITDPNPDNAVIKINASKISEHMRGGTQGLPPIPSILASITDPAPKQDLLAVRDLLLGEITQILGYGAPNRGGMPSTRSAREAVAIKERQDMQLHPRAAAVGNFYQTLIRKHMQIVQQTMVVDRYARVFDSYKDEFSLLKYTKDDIDGRFDYVIYAGSSRPKDTESKRAEARETFNTAAPLLMQAGYPIEPLIRWYGEQMNWRSIDSLFKNPKGALAQLGAVLFAAQQGQQIPPNALLEAAAQAVSAGLSPQEMQALKQKLQAGAQQPHGAPPPAKVAGDRGDPNAAQTAMGGPMGALPSLPQ